MLFNSFVFLFLFLPVVLIGFYVLGRAGHARTCLAWLVAGSLLFYGWPFPQYLALLGSSVLFNYLLGVLLARASSRALRRSGLRRASSRTCPCSAGTSTPASLRARRTTSLAATSGSCR